MTSTVLLTDLDNTIYNWVDFFAPCFRAMVHALSWATKLPEAEIKNQFRDIFVEHGSVEYQWSIQELPLCRSLPSDEVRRLVYIGRRAFDVARKKHLKPYAGVDETLRWATKAGITVVAVSNAPIYLAWRRIERLGLQAMFAGIAAAEGFEIPQDDQFAQDYRGKRPILKNKLELRIKQENIKPNSKMYLEVIQHLKVSPEETWVVGDSLSKDIRPALEVGAHGVWARYGVNHDNRNFETLLEITHWEKAQIENVYSQTPVGSFVVIDAFDDLRAILPAPQMNLELGI